MALVDTTVWIDFFSDRNEPHVMTLQKLIENEEDLSLCGVINAFFHSLPLATSRFSKNSNPGLNTITSKDFVFNKK